jgi:hypothetical protein
VRFLHIQLHFSSIFDLFRAIIAPFPKGNPIFDPDKSIPYRTFPFVVFTKPGNPPDKTPPLDY